MIDLPKLLTLKENLSSSKIIKEDNHEKITLESARTLIISNSKEFRKSTNRSRKNNTDSTNIVSKTESNVNSNLKGILKLNTTLTKIKFHNRNKSLPVNTVSSTDPLLGNRKQVKFKIDEDLVETHNVLSIKEFNKYVKVEYIKNNVPKGDAQVCSCNCSIY